MKKVAVTFNVVLFAFTCLVLAVDGPPTAAAYVVFTLWLLATPIFSAVVISLGLTNPVIRIGALACNVVLLGFTGWAFVAQYPHPNEEGLLAFTVLIFSTPIISFVALLLGGSGHQGLRFHLKNKAGQKSNSATPAPNC